MEEQNIQARSLARSIIKIITASVTDTPVAITTWILLYIYI